MFEKLGKLKYSKKIRIIRIQKKDLRDGVNCIGDHFIIKNSENYKIFDRICDHAGGKIVSRNEQHICPLHNWKFFPNIGKYENGIKKKQIKFIKKDNFLEFKEITSFPEIRKSLKKFNFKIKFINHAFIKIETSSFSFATDPWAIGPAFNNGWWLKKNTRVDWLDEIDKVNFIYISHNHPDHLHPLTLSKINKNKVLLVPKFQSKSTANFISSLGFKNIFKAEFNSEYKLKNHDFYFSLFKSGNFKDDSGIYFSLGNFTSLIDVDSQNINFDRLPNVDLYGSSFGGGARGYPWMFQNYKTDEQIVINDRSQKFFMKRKIENIKKMKPKFFLPYASYFEEKLPRDKRIKFLNKKINIDEYKKRADKLKITVLNTEEYDEFDFKGNKLINFQNSNKKKYNDLDPTTYLNYFKKNYSEIDRIYIKNYFENSKFNEKFNLYVDITDDNFKENFYSFLVIFGPKSIKFKDNIGDIKSHKKINLNNFMKLKVRKESFLYTVQNKTPWEDLQIGFQCKIKSNPEYNFNFWYHFTNIYIRNKYFRDTENCASCDKLNFYIDKNLSEESNLV